MLGNPKNGLALLASALCIAGSGTVLGQDGPSDCVVLGALAYDNWTKADAGGTGVVPTDVQNVDYIRCKACHGWDRLGTDGGYVRRTRTETRPNAGAGDTDNSSRAIVTGTVNADMVLHLLSGRKYDDGTASWVPLEPTHSATNKADHSRGYTLGNQHPDFSPRGPNWQKGIPSDLQIGCIVDFLNYEDGDPARYFGKIDPGQDPVQYTIVDTADASAGEAFFNAGCAGCHPLERMVDYVRGDGKFSELAHKVRWGIPDTVMVRGAMGDPTAQDVADLLLYLQNESGTGFALNPGLTGTWWNADRAGEGFLVEFGFSSGKLTVFASFYTYDNMGNQAWLVAQPADEVNPVAGTSVEVNVFRVTGPMWGDDFDSGDAVRQDWGTGTFSFGDCAAGSVTLTPGPEAEAMGFTELSYGLTRDLLTSGIACPTAD